MWRCWLMPKKLTLEDVKAYIVEHDVNHHCELLSTEYVNVTTPLRFKCNLCGEIFEKDFMHLKRRDVFCCQKCSKKEAGKQKSMGIEAVKKFIEENDKEHLCTLLSIEYKNSTTPLLFKCNKCGKNFYRDWSHIKRNRFQCPECGIHQGAIHKKYSKEDVIADIATRGYTMTGEYVDARTPFDAICKRGHKVKLIYSYFKLHHSGCQKCCALDHTGSNHPNWKGGVTEIIDYLRKSIKTWKKEVLGRDSFCCIVSGEHSNDLVVHHLKSFNTIVQEAVEQTGIPVLARFSDYQNDDYIKLRDKVLELYEISNGVTLTRKIHNLFHQEYGKGGNTPEQFQEFCERYKRGEFSS